jgi:hypothetical protein
MSDYRLVEDQTAWPDDLVLVQVFAGQRGAPPTAIIRSVVGNYVSEVSDVPDALVRAEHFRLINGLSMVGVHLTDGANWDQRWGNLWEAPV